MAQKSIKKAAQNNDGNNYMDYGQGQDYEHAAEEIALKRLLYGKHFRHAADIGGGYGRLCVLLKKYADQVTLAEPSKQQLAIAKDYLKDYPEIDQIQIQANDLRFADKSLDLITMIRVMPHLPDPSLEFKELHRVLTDDGYLVLEVANATHGRDRIKHLIGRKRLPAEPMDIRTTENGRGDETPFVNHNPQTVIKQLAHAGLKVEKALSVSNLHNPGIKKLMPHAVMLSLERIMQPALAQTYFGPTVFFLIRKAK